MQGQGLGTILVVIGEDQFIVIHEDRIYEGKPKRKPRRKVPFIELAVEHGLASADTADKTYRSALDKLKKLLKIL